EDAPELLRPSRLGLAQVVFGILDRAGQDVQAISKLLEVLARDHELVFAEADLEGAPAGLVIALAARPFAIEPRSSRPRGQREPPSAPTTRVLRHSDDIRRCGLWRAIPNDCARYLAVTGGYARLH